MAQASDRIDNKVERAQAGDSSRGIQPEAPPKSTQQIAASWDAAYSSHDFKSVNTDLSQAAAKAYEGGGTQALSKLQDNLNNLIKAPGAGPLFVITPNKIEIHNAQGYTADQAANLPASERAKLSTLQSAKGEVANVRDLSPVSAIDRPQTLGLKLKPGEKISSEFPSEYAVAAALKAGGVLNKDWMAGNSEQKYLVDHLPNAGQELSKIPKDMLDGIAQTGGVDKVNKFLADKGMDMRLDPVGGNDLAMAAVLSLKGAWAGRNSTMNIDGKDYAAATVGGVQAFKQNDTDVVQLYKKDGVTVYAAPIGDDKLSSYQVTERAHQLTPGADAVPQEGITKVQLPKVDKNVQTDLVGLKGLTATDGTRITQAKMQTKLAIDEKGFSAEQGVAMATTRGLSFNDTVKLDKPFLVWATKDGVSQPLFATSVGPEYWKDPKKATDK